MIGLPVEPGADTSLLASPVISTGGGVVTSTGVMVLRIVVPIPTDVTDPDVGGNVWLSSRCIALFHLRRRLHRSSRPQPTPSTDFDPQRRHFQPCEQDLRGKQGRSPGVVPTRPFDRRLPSMITTSGGLFRVPSGR